MLEQIFTFIIAVLSTVPVMNLLNKRRTLAETKVVEDQSKASELQNTEAAIKIWRELAESFEQKFTEREGAISDLKKQLDIITAQNTQLLSKIVALEKDYDRLQRNYNELKNSLKQ